MGGQVFEALCAHAARLLGRAGRRRASSACSPATPLPATASSTSCRCATPSWRPRCRCHVGAVVLLRPVVIARPKDEPLLELLVVEAAVRRLLLLGLVVGGTAITFSKVY